MKKFVRILALLIALSMLAFVFVACDDKAQEPDTNTDGVQDDNTNTPDDNTNDNTNDSTNGDGATPEDESDPNEVKIVILAGQSNAVGVGHTKHLEDHFSKAKVMEYKVGYENVKINYSSHGKVSNGFVNTTINCTQVGKDTFGPEVGMAEIFNAEQPANSVYIVKCAFGATNLSHDWLSPSGEKTVDSTDDKTGWCYDELIKILGESIEMLEAQGYNPRIHGFCWMQGESDAGDANDVNKYITRYRLLLKDLTKEFEGYFDENCDFVDAGISQTWMFYDRMNKIKKDFAEDNENYHYIDTIKEGLTVLNEPHGAVDPYHYDSDSVIKLGQLFAKSIDFND